jgi:hypothetical protein
MQHKEGVDYKANDDDSADSSEISDFIGDFGETIRVFSHFLYSYQFNATAQNKVIGLTLS